MIADNVQSGVNNSFSNNTVIVSTKDNRILGNPQGAVVGGQPMSLPLE